MKLKLQPFLFSASDVRAIAEATMLCSDSISRLVQLMQQIHRFRDANPADLLPSEVDYFLRLAARLEMQVALALYISLLNSGSVADGYLDLDTLSQQCRIKIAP